MTVPMIAFQMKLGNETLFINLVEQARRDRITFADQNPGADSSAIPFQSGQNASTTTRMQSLLGRYFGIQSSLYSDILNEPGRTLHHDALILIGEMEKS